MSADPRREPPRLADALLKRVLPPGKRGESILGDLREEFREIAEGGDIPFLSAEAPGAKAEGLSKARRWYWAQAVRLTLRYFTQPAPSPQLSRPRRSPMLMDLTSDLRTAVRMTLRNPGTSSLIVFTLAIAIGTATIAFTFADLALFRGLPVDDGSKVVSVFASDTHGSNPRARVSAADFLDYRARSTTLERIAVMRQARASLITDGQSRTLQVSYATGDVFAAMGQPAAAGRTLRLGDDSPGAAPVALLSHRYWQEEYGGRADALGRELQIGRELFTVVGVLTPEMEFGNLAEIDVWLPLQVTPDSSRAIRNLRLVARLRDGVDFDRAAAEMAAIGDALATEYPETNGGWRVRLIPIREVTGGEGFWVVIALFLLSIGLLMAIATANVSNLVLVRTLARERELAVRTALGARRARLVRQLLTEGTLLSIVAGALSLPAAWVGLQAIAAFSPEPVFHQLRIDDHEWTFVASLALVCPLVFTLASARTLARPDMRQVLASSGGRGATGSRRGRGALVVAQFALAVIMLTASTLAVRSTALLYTSPTGMDTSRLLIFGLDFDEVQYPSVEDAQAAALATANALHEMPGVEVVSALSALPILGAEGLTPVSIRNEVQAPDEARPTAVVTAASATVGQALGLTLLAGAWWREGQTETAVIARETAIRLFGDPSRALDRQIGLTLASGPQTVRVVGVVSDVADGNLRAMPARIWVPLDPATRRLSFVVKTAGDPAALTSVVRTVVAKTAAAAPIDYLQTFDAELRRAASSDYVIIGMLVAFAIIALVLASTGLFGVVSYTVSQRTAEFGTRMALGASAWDVVRLVGRQSFMWLGVGLSLGLAGGVGVASAMGSVLYGVSPTDPTTLTLVVAVLTAVTMLATALPAWRAARIDPVIALRAE
jgi:predicted permease